MNVLLIDNLDSFTFNLVESLRRLGAHVRVLRNSVAAASAMAEAEQSDSLLMLSPGPGGPEDAGCCLDLIAMARGRVPLVGICLGHQAIAHEAGAKVRRAADPVHGKATLIDHDGAGPFTALPSPLRVARYHSLGVAGLPPRFTVHARTGDTVMAFSDPLARQAGVQFHPESILTTHGDAMLANLLKI